MAQGGNADLEQRANDIGTWNHKWIGAMLEEAVDPELEATAKSELCSESLTNTDRKEANPFR
jgi:hypothetical protein